MRDAARAEPTENIQNRLRPRRLERGVSQGQLASVAGVTRQAIYAIETNQYLPTTAVALRLASALDCRVEDLFSLVSSGEVVEGDYVGGSLPAGDRVRVKVARVGSRLVVRPVALLGDVLNFTVPADGLLLGPAGRRGTRVRVELLRDRHLVQDEVVVAGCDPAIFLAGEYIRRNDPKASVVGWTMGSAAALEALKREEVHIAGVHVVDPQSGEHNLPYIRKHLGSRDMTVVTFAAWEEGLIVAAGNQKAIRHPGDLVRRDVTIVNREAGSGARQLLDRQLAKAGVPSRRVKGYDRVVGSHLEVARAVAQGAADAGIAIRSSARYFGLEFIPLQEERYDLVIPTALVQNHRGVGRLLEALVSRGFRLEVEALGGYDTRDTGKVQEPVAAAPGSR